MRLKTEIFVSSLIRRIFSDGGFAAVERKGEEAAGAVFIKARFRDGLFTVLGPAPQSFFEEDEALIRKFEIRLDRVEEDEASKLLSRETGFDPDLWIVEIEADSDLGTYFDIARDEDR